MATCVHLRWPVFRFFLELEIFHTKIVGKIRTHKLCEINLISKLDNDNADKYCRDGLATDDNKMLRMRFACWITKATDTRSEYVIFIAFPQQ